MHCTLQVAKAASTRYLKMEPLSPVRIYEVKTVAAAFGCLRTLVSFWHENLSMRFIFVESTFFPFNFPFLRLSICEEGGTQKKAELISSSFYNPANDPRESRPPRPYLIESHINFERRCFYF